jgi:transposase-like protein
MMKQRRRYPVEVRERAVSMVLEHQSEYGSQWAAIVSIGTKCGMAPETLRKWVRRAEVDAGLVLRRMRESGSVSWNVRTGSCAGRTRS